MEYVRLGPSGLKVGRIALGRMSFGDPTLGMHSWTLDEEASQPVLQQSLPISVAATLPRGPERRAGFGY